MNPCRLCLKKYDESPCEDFGHCVFEDSGVWPSVEEIITENYSRSAMEIIK